MNLQDRLANLGSLGLVVVLLGPVAPSPSRADCPASPADVGPGILDPSTMPPTWRVTGDGMVSVADVLVLLRAVVQLHVVNWTEPGITCPTVAGDLTPGELDVTTSPPTYRPVGDGTLDVSEVLIVLKAAVSLIQIAPALLPDPTKSRDVALLDLAQRNGESDAKPAAMQHALNVAGLPGSTRTQDVEIAVLHRMVACSSQILSSTFNATEEATLRDYVRRGGILIAPMLSDDGLFSLFGITDAESSRTRRAVSWNVAGGDPSLGWFDDPQEQTISLGRESYPQVIQTQGLVPGSAVPLAFFEDGMAAVTRNAYGAGHAHVLGFSFSDLIVRNQLNRDFDAQRSYSNGFEPTSDTIMLFLRGVYAAHVPFATWKHTSPHDSRASLLVTHDVDSSTGMETMRWFADLEAGRGVEATYFITTHYLSDALAGDYYTPYLAEIAYLRDTGHAIASHSVGHFPDFADSQRFPEGIVGNTMADYAPRFDGTRTTGGTVFGELEVSRDLLEARFGVDVRSFRSGHLVTHEKQINVLDALSYEQDSSRSANDVLTNFPYRAREDLSFGGLLSDVLEIPMTISDVFKAEPISADNYEDKVAIWHDVIERNAANGAPTTLLIHPNRDYKLAAEALLLDGLSPGIRVGSSLEAYGDYWRRRESTEFSTSLNDDVLTVTVHDPLLPAGVGQSFVIEDGMALSDVAVKDQRGDVLPFQSITWNDTDLLLYQEPIGQ